MEDGSVATFFSSVLTWLFIFLLRLIGAFLVLWLGKRLCRFFVTRMENGKRYGTLSKNMQILLKDAVTVGFWILITVAICGVLGIENATVAAALASVGLSVGLALQGSLSNFAGGVMILLFHPFSVGDFIDDGKNAGTVTDIGIFYSTLETPDRKRITLPNGVLSNSAVTDVSAFPVRRIDHKIAVGYSADIEDVKRILCETAAKNTGVLPDRPVTVRLLEMGDSALIFAFRVFVRSEEYWDTYFSLLEEAKTALDAAHIRIPYPQLDVHLKEK